MDVSLMFLFVTLANAGFFAWHMDSKRKQKRKPEGPSVVTTELHLLKTVLLMEKQERHRIANVLHYKSSSTLAAVKMYLTAVHATKNEEELNGNFDKVDALLESAYVEINKSLYSLMPEMVLENGLDDAVRKYCSHLTTHKLLIIEYDSWGVEKRYHEAFELAVFRFVQILLQYILQHNKATTTIVQMGMRSEALTLAIEDNGTGYKPAQELLEEPSFRHLESSIRALNGQLELHTDNGLISFIQIDTVAFGKVNAIPASGDAEVEKRI